MGLGEQKQLLFSLFTRDNPNGDSFIYRGFGPTRRRVDKHLPKRKDGKWNFVFNGDKYHKRSSQMPNPDELIETFTIPICDRSFDLVERASTLQEGGRWLESCKKYLAGWDQSMPTEMPFEIQLSDMPKLHYLEEKGPSAFQGGILRNHCCDFEHLPEEMIHGIFHPQFFTVPWREESGKIGMRLNGGVIIPNNERWNYTVGTSIDGLPLSLPWAHQLIGKMGRRDLKGIDSDEYLRDQEFPRIHFIEYIFAHYCSGKEENPCPGIRIEMKPESLEQTTLAREKEWSRKRVLEEHMMELKGYS